MRAALGAISLALAAVLMTGCALLDVRSGYKLAPTSGKGILSVGLTANDDMPNFYWHLRKVGETESKDLTFWSVQNPLMWTNPQGRLAMIELEQGDYELFDWQVLFGFAPTKYFRIPFSIRAGRVTYLGRLHLDLDKEQMRFAVNTQDRYSDDYAVLRDRIPNISAELIDQTEAVFQPCGDPTCDKPIPEPIKMTITIPIVINTR